MKLILENVTKSFGKQVVIDDANYEFEKGKIYALLGRNGSGKTTLFDCINKDKLIDSGNVLLEKDNVRNDVSFDDIGYISATPSVPPFLTAKEFIQFLIEANHDLITDVQTPEYYLKSIGIKEEDMDKLLRDFSLGMQNKVQMLVTFILKPNIMLLDEPLTSFDIVAADIIKKHLVTLKNDYIIILSTHIMEIAMELCDEIVLLVNGKLEKTDKDVEKIVGSLKGDDYA